METQLEKKVAEQRVVTIFTTLGKNAQEFKSAGSTWEEIQKDMKHLNFDYSGMKVVVGDTRLTVESPRAVMPEGNFTLFFMPVKTKSGAEYSRSELFSLMKAEVEKKKTIKETFQIDGKNMTQLSTPVLQVLWRNYKTGSTDSVSVPETVAKKETPQPTKATNGVTEKVIDPLQKKADTLHPAVKLYDEIVSDLKDEDVDESVATVIIAKARRILELFGLVSPAETEAEKAKKLEAMAEKLRMEEKSRELAAMASDLMGDFKDVRK